MLKIADRGQSVNLGDNVSGVELDFQGGLVVARVKRKAAPRGGPRGVVSEFSPASRNRLLKFFARLDAHAWAVFITLTYMQDFPSPAVAKTHLRAFEARLMYFAPGCSWVWRMEFQKRGAPHFHFVVFGLPFLEKKRVQEWWAEIIGAPGERPFTRIEALKSRRKLTAYVSKYVAKVGGGVDGFNLLAYLQDGEFVHPVTGELSGSVGRWWGVGNRSKLPFAVQAVVVLSAAALPFLYQFRRAARHVWRGVSRRPEQGFSLFVGDARRWLDFWFAVVVAAA